MKQIKVSISPDGEVAVEASGFSNNSCKKATKPIEEALGMANGVKNKPEAYVTETPVNQQKQGYGW